MKKKEANLREPAGLVKITAQQIKIRRLELAKLWGSNFWEGDLEQMRTNID